MLSVFDKNKSLGTLDGIVKKFPVDINGPSSNVTIRLTEDGSAWLATPFCIFAVLMIFHGFMYVFTKDKRKPSKTLLLIPLLINSIMTYAYFTYASDLGSTGVPVELTHAGTGIRQVFYSKFIAWFLTWPLVLISFEITSHTSSNTDNETDFVTRVIQLFQNVFIKLVYIEIFIVLFLIGALVETTYKWGYFTFGVCALLFVSYLVCVDVHRSFLSDAPTSKWGNYLVYFTLFIWHLYPISWGLSEGGNVIQPDSEAVFYGILDLINFGIVPTALTWISVRNINEECFRNGVGNGCPCNCRNKELESIPTGQSGDTAVGAYGRYANDETV
ncbi:HSP31 [[Candida] subhashii]|uniref:HSP31 n=1 Tax=[Candida] subhashii TaxID=561895 RepID=A0A8J5V580_9ASCO|nr:HSP31 [[Candida] subhashii]KAG7665779.1 HSP31 [[Candida] subhashii]